MYIVLQYVHCTCILHTFKPQLQTSKSKKFEASTVSKQLVHVQFIHHRCAKLVFNLLKNCFSKYNLHLASNAYQPMPAESESQGHANWTFCVRTSTGDDRKASLARCNVIDFIANHISESASHCIKAFLFVIKKGN